MTLGSAWKRNSIRVIPGAARDRVDELYVRGLDAYARGDSDIAIGHWQEALELNPRFTPAKTSLEPVRNLLDLQQSIEQIEIEG